LDAYVAVWVERVEWKWEVDVEVEVEVMVGVDVCVGSAGRR